MITLNEFLKVVLLGTAFGAAYYRLRHPRAKSFEIERIIKLTNY